MANIILYQFPKTQVSDSASPPCIKVHRVLGYKKIPYDIKNIGSPLELKRLNPGIGKLPVMSYNDERVVDSSFIISFLEKKHPEIPVIPTNAQERALHHLWEDWADESLYWFAVYFRWCVDKNFALVAKNSFSNLPFPFKYIVPKVARKKISSQVFAQGLGRLPLDKIFSNLDEHLEMINTTISTQDFLTGKKLYHGDIALFAVLQPMSSFLLPELEERIQKYPKIISWLKRVNIETLGQHGVSYPV